jgi:hypothetical protein
MLFLLGGVAGSRPVKTKRDALRPQERRAVGPRETNEKPGASQAIARPTNCIPRVLPPEGIGEDEEIGEVHHPVAIQIEAGVLSLDLETEDIGELEEVREVDDAVAGKVGWGVSGSDNDRVAGIHHRAVT